MLNRAFFFCTVKKGKLRVVKASLYDIIKAIEVEDLKECPLEKIVPDQYHGFLLQLKNVLPDMLPPFREGMDLQVRLKDAEIRTWGPLYSMSRAESVVLK